MQIMWIDFRKLLLVWHPALTVRLTGLKPLLQDFARLLVDVDLRGQELWEGG